MKYRQYFQIMLALSSLLAAAVAASPAQATPPGYVYSTDGKTPVRDTDGHCVRTNDWRKEYATPECNPELLPAPKAVAPAAPVRAAEPAPAVAPAPAPADSDRDGVPDSLDKCPDSPAGVKVDSSGCPLDSDHDGVADYLDKCPDTTTGVKVDSSGCPLDSDRDGVPDSLDKCPDTPSGARVDKDGCVEAITLYVHFDTAKWTVKKEYYPEIEKFAAYLNRYANVKAEIQGYTDNVGDPKKNVSLSQHRAKAIMDILVEKYKIDRARLSAKGYGAENPIAPNDTKEGREKNRRVEAIIIK